MGASVGAGQWLTSIYITALLMLINLGFRPLSRYIDKHSLRQKHDVVYRILVACSDTHEGRVRNALLESIAERPLTLRQLRTEDGPEAGEVQLHVEIEAPENDRSMIEQIVQRMRSDESVSSVEIGEGTGETE